MIGKQPFGRLAGFMHGAIPTKPSPRWIETAIRRP